MSNMISEMTTGFINWQFPKVTVHNFDKSIDAALQGALSNSVAQLDMQYWIAEAERILGSLLGPNGHSPLQDSALGWMLWYCYGQNPTRATKRSLLNEPVPV